MVKEHSTTLPSIEGRLNLHKCLVTTVLNQNVHDALAREGYRDQIVLKVVKQCDVGLSQDTLTVYTVYGA